MSVTSAAQRTHRLLHRDSLPARCLLEVKPLVEGQEEGRAAKRDDDREATGEDLQ